LGKISLQNCAILRNALRKRNYQLPTVSNDMQTSETLGKPLLLNYKSAALPAELCRQNAAHINAHRRLEQVAKITLNSAVPDRRPNGSASNQIKATLSARGGSVLFGTPYEYDARDFALTE
jgi:hypothetical protein